MIEKNKAIYQHRIRIASFSIIIFGICSILLLLPMGIFNEVDSRKFVFILLERSAFLVIGIIILKSGLHILLGIAFILYIYEVLSYLNSGIFNLISSVVLVGIGLFIVLGFGSSLILIFILKDSVSPKRSSGATSGKRFGEREKSVSQPIIEQEIDELKYFSVLEIQPGASPEQIKSAYREQLQKYHPDKVSHLGSEIKKIAEKRTLELNTAYKYLMGKYNF